MELSRIYERLSLPRRGAPHFARSGRRPSVLEVRHASPYLRGET